VVGGQQYIEEQDCPLVANGNMTAGDTSFHNGWALHSAPSNATNVLRKVRTSSTLPTARA
jgi:hypothetical protein